MSEAPTLIIASLSARALARSARRAGYRVLALDCFGDADTRKAAAGVRTLPCDAQGFQADALLKEVAHLLVEDPHSGLVYGSGFEQRPALLDRLAEICPVYGNSSKTVLHAKDPSYWSASLDQWGFKYPETVLESPREPEGWLAKCRGGSGGWHVRWAAAAPRSADWFYQRRIDGPTYSVLFLADGCQTHIIGFNRQWSYREAGGSGFGYAGALSKAELPQRVRDELYEAVARLTQTFELRGLNGIDFVLGADARPYLLELNPRPTATVELWDDDYWPDGLVAAHIQACRGTLPDRCPVSASIRGHAIVYAQSTFVIPGHLALPEWCRDIPHGGSEVQVGQPFCSVFAEGTHAESVQNLIWFRRELIQRSLSCAKGHAQPSMLEPAARLSAAVN